MYQSKANTKAILLVDHRFERERILYPCIVVLVYTTRFYISYILVSWFKAFVLLLLIQLFFLTLEKHFKLNKENIQLYYLLCLGMWYAYNKLFKIYRKNIAYLSHVRSTVNFGNQKSCSRQNDSLQCMSFLCVCEILRYIVIMKMCCCEFISKYFIQHLWIWSNLCLQVSMFLVIWTYKIKF